MFGRTKALSETPDLKTLYGETWQLAMENDFLDGALPKSACEAKSDERLHSGAACRPAIPTAQAVSVDGLLPTEAGLRHSAGDHASD